MNPELHMAGLDQQATLQSQVILLVVPCAMNWVLDTHETHEILAKHEIPEMY
ncbi:hypothetical protein BG015_008459, partial [Linnemannia schmuckeri]